MDTLTINLDGISTEIRRQKIDLNKLVLDIENPRIQYFLDTRLNDNITQQKIKFALAEGNDQAGRWQLSPDEAIRPLTLIVSRQGGVACGPDESPDDAA